MKARCPLLHWRTTQEEANEYSGEWPEEGEARTAAALSHSFGLHRGGARINQPIGAPLEPVSA